MGSPFLLMVDIFSTWRAEAFSSLWGPFSPDMFTFCISKLFSCFSYSIMSNKTLPYHGCLQGGGGARVSARPLLKIKLANMGGGAFSPYGGPGGPFFWRAVVYFLLMWAFFSFTPPLRNFCGRPCTI